MINNIESSSSSFMQSNTIVAKVAFILIVVLVFVILLQFGMGVLTYFLGPNGTPKLTYGMVPGHEAVIFKQDQFRETHGL